MRAKERACDGSFFGRRISPAAGRGERFVRGHRGSVAGLVSFGRCSSRIDASTFAALARIKLKKLGAVFRCYPLDC
jgi:hypothetical protein